jgi:hypothetical protein
MLKQKNFVKLNNRNRKMVLKKMKNNQNLNPKTKVFTLRVFCRFGMVLIRVAEVKSIHLTRSQPPYPPIIPLQRGFLCSLNHLIRLVLTVWTHKILDSMLGSKPSSTYTVGPPVRSYKILLLLNF